MKYANKRWRWWFIVHMNERSCCLQRSVATIECLAVLEILLRNPTYAVLIRHWFPYWVLETNAFTALNISYDTCWISGADVRLIRLEDERLSGCLLIVRQIRPTRMMGPRKGWWVVA
jgi:hypothetical protein